MFGDGRLLVFKRNYLFSSNLKLKYKALFWHIGHCSFVKIRVTISDRQKRFFEPRGIHQVGH
jgi:hypothetical protein